MDNGLSPRGRTPGARLANEEVLPLGLDGWHELCEFPVWWALAGAATVTTSPTASSGDTKHLAVRLIPAFVPFLWLRYLPGASSDFLLICVVQGSVHMSAPPRSLL